MFGQEWTSEYYDVMEFYYWEPQHLGKIKNKKSSYNNQKQVLEHIQNMEVSLNHLFNVFFRLAPASFTNEIIHEFFNVNIEEGLMQQGRYAVSEYSSLVQPDLLFSSKETNFSIEMKIGAKSSLEQVYKYSLLHWLEQNHNNKKEETKKSLLLYIGKSDFKSLWKEHFSTVEELKEAVIVSDIEKLKIKASKNEEVEINWEEVADLVKKTTIAYCTYYDLASLLQHKISKLSKRNDESETVLKLYTGLYLELKRRGLAISTQDNLKCAKKVRSLPVISK